MSFEDALAMELEAAVQLSGTPDFSEGIRAFREKRPPKWK
jgi:enoyl-CoA hydratase/carnithine racemase